MKRLKLEHLIPLTLALLVLFSGLALLPIAGFSAERLDWQRFANIYQPVLNVDPALAAPGSAFVFDGSGYPPLATGTVYVDGIAVGAATTDATGAVAFAIQSHAVDAVGVYAVTLATDANTSATATFTLATGADLVPLPPGFGDAVFGLSHLKFLPVVHQND